MSSSSESILSGDEENPDLELDSGVVFTRLSEVVREHYLEFLVKLLKENYASWCKNAEEQSHEQKYIEDCAKLLEEKAMKSCMVVQIYRNAMVKIIANVRRSTQECRLQHHLRIVIEKHTIRTQLQSNNKATQTDNEAEKKKNSPQTSQSVPLVDDNDFISPELQLKMEFFQEKLKNDAAAMIGAKKARPRQRSMRPVKKYKRSIVGTEIPETASKTTNSIKDDVATDPLLSTPSNCNVPAAAAEQLPVLKAEEDDLVARELAQLFSEEKTEIDEIFGYQGNETDDPQISSILKEIENAKLPNEVIKHEGQEETPVIAELTVSSTIDKQLEEHLDDDANNTKQQKDLRHSLWPCELYMQRRNLSKRLSCLIEEDFRWHEIMKWKFLMLFGEDSDDEFASYSPSIELDEVLMCSCIKRISPWVVKHLMKPMNDGLIANRFLFKKLARKLSRAIITENQYPDEKMIKNVVENFFCLRQAVSSMEDLELPFISLSNGNDKLFED